MDFLGILFDPSKDAGPTDRLPLLGNIEDYSQSDFDDATYLCAQAERVAAVSSPVRVGLLERL